MPLNEKSDQIYSAVVVAVLLIGTASGSAMLMLVLSAIALSFGVIFFRSRLNNGPMRVMMVAAITAIIVALVTVVLMR